MVKDNLFNKFRDYDEESREALIRACYESLGDCGNLVGIGAVSPYNPFSIDRIESNLNLIKKLVMSRPVIELTEEVADGVD